MTDVHVLIVAPSAFHLALMADLLEANGIRTQRASAIDAAVLAARQVRPVLVVLDLALPAEDTERLALEFGADPSTADLPIVVVGGAQERATAIAILGGAVAGELSRPLDTSALSRRVVQEVRRRTTRAGRSALAHSSRH